MTSMTLSLAAVTALLAPGDSLADDPATGALKVVTRPEGAVIVVDGRPRGSSPVLLELPVGEHAIAVRMDGYAPTSRSIAVAKDRITRAEVRLERDASAKQKAPPPTAGDIAVHESSADTGPGTVTIATSPPGLTVFMNDYLVPQPTPVAFDLRAGTYELSIEDNGEVVHRRTVFVQEGRTLALDLTIRKVRKIDYGDPWQ